MTDADQSGGQSDQSGNPAWNPGSLLVKTTQVEGSGALIVGGGRCSHSPHISSCDYRCFIIDFFFSKANM